MVKNENKLKARLSNIAKAIVNSYTSNTKSSLAV